MATELFSNNARGVLAEGIGPLSKEIILESGLESFSSPPNYASWLENGGYFQRATIYHPDDPDHNEIVFITDVDEYSGTLYVKRIQEHPDGGGTPPSWPAGSIIEARVTAGMLESLSHGKPYLNELPTIPADLPHKGPLFAPMVTGRSVNVPLGPIGALTQWAAGEIDVGEIVIHEDAPSTYFVAMDRGVYEYPLPGFSPPASSGVIVVNDEWYVDRRFYAQRTDEPITIQLNDDGIGMVVTEVGFVSIYNAGDGPAQISVSVGDVELAQNVSIDETDTRVVRFFNQSQRLTPTDSIQVNVLTRSTDEMKGYFYWVGFPTGPVLA